MKQPDIDTHYIWKCDCGHRDLASISDVLYEGVPHCPTCDCGMELLKTGEEHDFKKAGPCHRCGKPLGNETTWSGTKPFCSDACFVAATG